MWNKLDATNAEITTGSTGSVGAVVFVEGDLIGEGMLFAGAHAIDGNFLRSGGDVKARVGIGCHARRIYPRLLTIARIIIRFIYAFGMNVDTGIKSSALLSQIDEGISRIGDIAAPAQTAAACCRPL